MKTQLIKSVLALCILIVVFCIHSNAQSTALDNFILNNMNDNHIPGLSAALIKDGKIAWTKGYGYANIEKNIPFTPNTINSEIASLSKMVTSTAIMKLWEQNLFELDDPINNYLSFDVINPFYPDIPITFRMLLTHTSSTGVDNNVLSSFLYVAPGTAEPLDVFLQSNFVPGGSLYIDSISYFNYAPGTQMNYSNFGYALLASLVEQISGMSFVNYCNQNIFQPLCMNHTSWYYSGVDTNVVSRPYYYDNGSIKQNEYSFYEALDYPCRQIKSTVIDLSKYLTMNMNYGILEGVRILDSATVATIRTLGIVNFDDGINYKFGEGLGWGYIKQYGNNKEYWGRDGGDYGVSTQMWNNSTDNTGVIILTNGESIDYSILFYLFDYAATISTSSLPPLNCSYISTPCELSENYWKNNSSQWALNAIPMKIGTKHIYTKNQTLDVLNLPVNGDASILLGKALIAAKLNMAQGSELSPIILTINAAMNLIGAKRLPFNVPIPFTSPAGIQMLALAATLNSYNSGIMNTSACSGSLLREAGETMNEIVSDAVSVYPNPVSNSTTISFAVSQPQKVSIKIFDLNGRLVSTLADDNFGTGESKIVWNAEIVHVGIYFLQIQSSELTKTMKLVVTK